MLLDALPHQAAERHRWHRIHFHGFAGKAFASAICLLRWPGWQIQFFDLLRSHSHALKFNLCSYGKFSDATLYRARDIHTGRIEIAEVVEMRWLSALLDSIGSFV